MSAPDEEYLTATEAAALPRVAPSTVRRWIRAGQLPAYRFGQRRVAIRRTDLDEVITPVRPIGQRASRMPGNDRTDAEVRNRRLTPEDVERGLTALEHAQQISRQILAERGEELFSPSWEILNELRDERTRQLG